jgi:hypothetical protein
MKKKALLFLLTISILILGINYSSYSGSLPESFIYVIEDVEKFALQKGIRLEQDENIKDVVTLGYFNALKRLGAPFGSLNDKIKTESIEWLSLLCWIPIIPPDKKKNAEEDIKKVRKALAKNIYERTLASLSLVPGFAVSCVGEILPTSQWIKDYPYSPMSKEIYTNLTKTGFSSHVLISDIKAGKINYEDIIFSEWVSKYLKEAK